MVLIKGAGDLATGVAVCLRRAGFSEEILDGVHTAIGIIEVELTVRRNER